MSSQGDQGGCQWSGLDFYARGVVDGPDRYRARRVEFEELLRSVGAERLCQDLLARLRQEEATQAAMEAWANSAERRLLADWEAASEEDHLRDCRQRREIHAAKGWHPTYRYGPQGEKLAAAYLESLPLRYQVDARGRSVYLSYTAKEQAEAAMELAEKHEVAGDLVEEVRRIVTNWPEVATAYGGNPGIRPQLAWLLQRIPVATLARRKFEREADLAWERP